MKNNIKKTILIIILFNVSVYGFDGNYLFQLESAPKATIDAIATPQKGMMVFDATNNNINYYNNTTWMNVTQDLEYNASTYILKISDKDGATDVDLSSFAAVGPDIPFISSVKINVAPSVTKTFTIEGKKFTPTSDVSIINPTFDGTIDTVNVLSPTSIEVTVTTTATEELYDLVITNGGVLNTQWSGNGVDGFEVKKSWIDLRLGGEVFTDGNAAGNDIRYKSTMSMSRDANGMYFTGQGIWSSWVKFESLGWTRGSSKTLQWIFAEPDGAMMIGIGSDATNESASTQYQQSEVVAYFSASSLSSLHGNNGTVGSETSQSNSTSLNSCGSDVFKIKFENDGSAGGQFTLYCLPSAAESDWDDELTVMKTFAIGGSLNPDEVNIMPFIIPRSGGAQRFIAVRVE
jgi:hypothetical protein